MHTETTWRWPSAGALREADADHTAESESDAVFTIKWAELVLSDDSIPITVYGYGYWL